MVEGVLEVVMEVEVVMVEAVEAMDMDNGLEEKGKKSMI